MKRERETTEDIRVKRNGYAAGLPVTVLRENGELRLEAEGFGDITDRFPEIVESFEKDLGRSFRLAGELVFYRGWTRQPVEVAETVLESAETPKELRPLLILRDVECVDGRFTEDLDVRNRQHTLEELVRDSDVIQRRGPRGHLTEDSVTSSRTAEAYGNDQDGRETDRSMDGAVDVLYSCGYLDLEGVEARLAKMKREIGERDAAIDDLRGRIERQDAERDAEESLVDLGRSRLDEWRNEAVARIRAIRTSRGEEPGDDPRIRLLEDPDPEPATIRDIHRKVTEEFNALFSTEPASIAWVGAERDRVRWDWDSFRI